MGTLLFLTGLLLIAGFVGGLAITGIYALFATRFLRYLTLSLFAFLGFLYLVGYH